MGLRISDLGSTIEVASNELNSQDPDTIWVIFLYNIV